MAPPPVIIVILPLPLVGSMRLPPVLRFLSLLLMRYGRPNLRMRYDMRRRLLMIWQGRAYMRGLICG